MEYSQFRLNLHEWIRKRGSLSGVAFTENLSPINHPEDDYQVKYEAVFEPEVLNKARLEFWCTDDGYVSVGFEKYERFKNLICSRHWRNGFIGGHEPSKCTDEYIFLTLDLVSTGAFSISYIAKFGFLFDLHICLREEDFAKLKSTKANVNRWIKAKNSQLPGKFYKEITYSSW